MKYRVFLDTNVFIYSFEFQDSNSGKIIELLNDEQLEGVISEQYQSAWLRKYIGISGNITAKTSQIPSGNTSMNHAG